MADLATGFGEVCRQAILGANAQLESNRSNYLEYLSKRTKAETPQEAFAELVTLTDRSLLTPDDIFLQQLSVTGKYQHSLGIQEGANGTLTVAIGPASATLGGNYQSNQTDTSDLTLGAVFGSRPRAQYLAQLVQSINALQPVLVETGAAAEEKAKPKP